MQIASCYVESKKYDEAIEVYQQISQEFPGSEYARGADLNRKIINEWVKKGKVPTEEELAAMMREAGLK